MSLAIGVRVLLLLLLIQVGSWQPIGVSSIPCNDMLAVEDQLSYLALVRVPGVICTGAIISVKTVLVSEMCTKKWNSSLVSPENVNVAYNKINSPSMDLDFKRVEKLFSPPEEDRDPNYADTDITLLIMKDPIPDYISIAAIPAQYLQYPLGKVVHLTRRSVISEVNGHSSNFLRYDEMDVTKPETCLLQAEERHFHSFCLDRTQEEMCDRKEGDIAVMVAEDGTHIVLGTVYVTGRSKYRCLVKGSKSSNFTDWILQKGVGPFKIYNGENDWSYYF